MASTRKYFHDHQMLLLLSIDAFLAIAGVLYFLLRLSSSHGTAYIVEYRSAFAINKFPTGTLTDMLAFAVFPLLVLAVHSILSYRVYHIHRQLAIAILSLGSLLLILNIIVSNALLILR